MTAMELMWCLVRPWSKAVLLSFILHPRERPDTAVDYIRCRLQKWIRLMCVATAVDVYRYAVPNE